jgi:hypothetical protein
MGASGVAGRVCSRVKHKFKPRPNQPGLFQLPESGSHHDSGARFNGATCWEITDRVSVGVPLPKNPNLLAQQVGAFGDKGGKSCTNSSPSFWEELFAFS